MYTKGKSDSEVFFYTMCKMLPDKKLKSKICFLSVPSKAWTTQFM